MPFENLRKQIADAQRQAQNSAQNRSDAYRDAQQKEEQLKQESSKRFWAEMEQLHFRRQQALRFREESGLSARIEEFIGLVRGEHRNSNFLPSYGSSTESGSELETIVWDRKELGSFLQGSKREFSEVTNKYEISNRESYMIIETLSDGNIDINSQDFKPPWRLFKTKRKMVPGLTWRQDRSVIENLMMESYRKPKHRFYSTTHTFSHPIEFDGFGSG